MGHRSASDIARIIGRRLPDRETLGGSRAKRDYRMSRHDNACTYAATPSFAEIWASVAFSASADRHAAKTEETGFFSGVMAGGAVAQPAQVHIL